MKKIIVISMALALTACSTTKTFFFDMKNNDEKFKELIIEEISENKNLNQEDDDYSTVLIQNCDKRTNECMFLKSFVKKEDITSLSHLSRTEYISRADKSSDESYEISYDHIEEGYYFEAIQLDDTLNISLDTIDLLSLDVHYVEDDVYIELPHTQSMNFETVIVEKNKINIVENKYGKLYVYWSN